MERSCKKRMTQHEGETAKFGTFMCLFQHLLQPCPFSVFTSRLQGIFKNQKFSFLPCTADQFSHFCSHLVRSTFCQNCLVCLSNSPHYIVARLLQSEIAPALCLCFVGERCGLENDFCAVNFSFSAQEFLREKTCFLFPAHLRKKTNKAYVCVFPQQIYSLFALFGKKIFSLKSGELHNTRQKERFPFYHTHKMRKRSNAAFLRQFSLSRFLLRP